jgi:hypothetical protein
MGPNIMVLLPYVSQLSNVTRQLKDIYGLHVCVQLVMMTVVSGHDIHNIENTLPD